MQETILWHIFLGILCWILKTEHFIYIILNIPVQIYKFVL